MLSKGFKMSTPPTPFKLVSAALYQARHPLQETTYSRWRLFLNRLESYRGVLDPVADQNANLDVLLRSMEENIQEEISTNVDMHQETAGLQLHIHLSRLWVFGAYEFIRSLHKRVSDHHHPDALCMRRTNSKGCGENSCVTCAIGHIKNELALVRMVLAKGEVAGDVRNPPLAHEMILKINAEPFAIAPPVSKFLCQGEGLARGIMAWYVFDQRVDRHRTISRRDLSERILHGLDQAQVGT